MGISLFTRYTPKATAPTGAYPEGSAVNNTIPSGTDGTPFEKDILNDIYGFWARLTSEAGITISDTPDDFNNSDYYNSLITLFSMKYDTVADMIAADLQVGSFVQTKGYLVAGDGGGAKYQIVAPATGTDDGGEFHDLTNTNQAQLIPDDIVTSKQYGAVGNGIADDTPQIQNLIDAFNWIRINTISLVTGITIKSESCVEISETLTIADGDLITGTSIFNTNIIFCKDGVLAGDNVNSDIGILLDGCTNVNIMNPVIAQFTTAGISKTNGSNSCKTVFGIIQSCEAGITIEDTTSLYNEVTSVKLNLNNYGLKVLGASYNRIDNLSCVANVNAGILLQDKTGGCTGNILKGCICNDGTGVGATDGGLVINPVNVLTVPFDNIISSIVCNNNASHGINIVPAVGGISATDIKIIAPVCRNNTKSGIYVQDGRQIEIANATCISNTEHGIDTENGFDIIINGGDYRDNDIDGIHHQSESSLVIAANCTLNGRYGLSVSNPSVASVPVYHRIKDCIFFNNATDEVNFSGTYGDIAKANNCIGDYETDNRGVISAQDGDTIGHGLNPQTGYTLSDIIIIATPTNQGHIVTIKNKTAVGFDIDLVDETGTPIAVNEDINWEAHLY